MNTCLFFTKKVISLFLYPLPFACFAVMAGLVMILFSKRLKLGKALLSLGLVVLFVFSNSFITESLLGLLETQAGNYAKPDELKNKGVKYIVILGGDVRAGNVTPVESAGYISLTRLMEGIRLWKELPGSILVLSGGTPLKEIPATGSVMAAAARELGVPESAIIVETESWDTDDEARIIKPIVGSKPFALVTSASHMPRSMMIFKRAGLNPIAAPADFETKKGVYTFRSVFPSAGALYQSHKAVHEYLGIAAFKVKNLIHP